MWELLTSFLLEIALKVLPSFIVRRLLPKHVLISELEIDFKTKCTYAMALAKRSTRVKVRSANVRVTWTR